MLNGYYWSSSEYSYDYAWYSYLTSSYGLIYYNKNYDNYVRPVLAL